MFLSRYQDRPSTLKADHEVDVNGRKGTIHSLNDFNVTVWEDGEVTAQRKHYVSSDPKSHFPNMTVEQGSINFPIEDLVAFILERVTPEEMADGIISDDEARAGLVYKMSERYTSPGFTDEDRRAFLNKVQQQVHAVALDKLVERLNKLESSARSYSDRERWRGVELGHYTGLYERYVATLYELRETGVIDDDGVQRRKSVLTTPDRLAEWIKEGRDPVDSESVGKQWYESRDYWRGELQKFFPEPEAAIANTEAAQ